MKLRAGRQTEGKIPQNLSFHRQIFKNYGFEQKSVYKMQFLQRIIALCFDLNNLNGIKKRF